MLVEANRFINLGGGEHPLMHLHFVAAQDLPNGPTVDTEVTSELHQIAVRLVFGDEV
jgi:hypothetical protein